jgi:hypothetical protein
MKVYGNMRDLLNETPPIDPGRTPEEETARVALPGDAVEGIDNPYAGKNPQGLLRLLRSGSLSPDEEGQVRQALALFEGFSGGDRVTGGMSRPAKAPPMAPSAALPDVVNNPDRVPELENVFRSWNNEE